MTSLTDAELASAAGTSPGMIARLRELGLLSSPADGGHARAAIARVRLILAFTASGIGLEAIAAGVRGRALDLRFVDDLMPEPIPLQTDSYAGLAARLGLPPETADTLREMLGTIDASGSAPMRADDAEVYAIIGLARALGATDEQIMSVVRATATAVWTIVRVFRDFVDSALVEPAVATGATAGEALLSTSVARREYRRMGVELTRLFMGRFMDDAVFHRLRGSVGS